MLLFANTDNSLADKIMSTMKRGTLVFAIFFFLAIIAGIGPHASKFSKAFGALIIVAIVITAPVGTVLTDVDNIVKNDWVGSDEHGDDTSADLATASNSSASASSSPVSAIEAALKAEIDNKKGTNPISNAMMDTLNGIIPGLGNYLGHGGVKASEGIVGWIAGHL